MNRCSRKQSNKATNVFARQTIRRLARDRRVVFYSTIAEFAGRKFCDRVSVESDATGCCGSAQVRKDGPHLCLQFDDHAGRGRFGSDSDAGKRNWLEMRRGV